MEVVIGVMLTVMAVQDWRTGKIAAWCPAVCIVVGVIVRIIENSLGTGEFWIGLLIGLAVLAVSAISSGQLGIGDGWVLAACGICLGWKKIIALLFGSMLLFVTAGAAGMLLKGWTGKKVMPYIPFVWVAFMVNCALNR